MLSFFRNLFATDFMAHRFCLRESSLISLEAASDVIIAASYALIPMALLLLLRRRKDLAFRWMFALFGIFILGCGMTHVMGFVTLWNPAYRLDALLKVVTAAASLPTALLMFKLLPKIQALPSPAMLQAEIRHREQAQLELHDSHSELERRVAERTQELRDANRELAKSNARLAESEARFRAITDATPNLLWTADAEGNCLYVNSLYQSFTGLPFESLRGRGWLGVVHADDRNRVRKLWSYAVLHEEEFEVEYRLRRFDGSYCWFVGRVVPMRDEIGQISKWMGSCTDIEALKQSETALRRSNDELRQFAYVAAHDLQEPLRNVSNAVGVLKRFCRDKLDPRTYQWLDVSVEGVDRMHAMIQDLLSYSRVLDDADRGLESVCPKHAVELALRNLEESLKESGAVVTTGELPRLKMQQLHLVQIFQNLIGNSIKYRRADTKPLIEVTASREGDTWTFTVRDNGIGFEPQYGDKIFEVFKRLHVRSEYPGNGIGLAICARIVAHYGGMIRAEGQVGQGAAFHFALPRAQES